MSRNAEPAAEAGKSSNLDLLGRLDANVKAAAKRAVTKALMPHERKIVDQLTDALNPVAGSCRHYIAERISEAFRLIQSDAERNTYHRMVNETIDLISDGKPVDLT